MTDGDASDQSQTETGFDDRRTRGRPTDRQCDGSTCGVLMSTLGSLPTWVAAPAGSDPGHKNRVAPAVLSDQKNRRAVVWPQMAWRFPPRGLTRTPNRLIIHKTAKSLSAALRHPIALRRQLDDDRALSGRGDRDETIHHAMDVLNLVFTGVWGPEDRRTGRLRHLSSLTRRRRGRVSTRDRPSPHPRSGAPLDFGWSKSPRISTRQTLSRILVRQSNLAPSSPRRLKITEAFNVEINVISGRRTMSSLWLQRVGHDVRQGASRRKPLVIGDPA